MDHVEESTELRVALFIDEVECGFAVALTQPDGYLEHGGFVIERPQAVKAEDVVRTADSARELVVGKILRLEARLVFRVSQQADAHLGRELAPLGNLVVWPATDEGMQDHLVSPPIDNTEVGAATSLALFIGELDRALDHAFGGA